MSLEILKAAASIAPPEPVEGFPPDLLRITLEYPEAPDPAVERARLAALLEGEGFSLTVLDEDLPEFLVLQFPEVERRQAPDTLFAAADALVDALGLVSAVPDIPSTFVVAPDDPDRLESVGERILDQTCWVEERDHGRLWQIEKIRALPAWSKSKGKGVLIAQPDTGVASHAELAEALDLASGFNTLTGTSDPTDPLHPGMGNPGHGTATASAVAARGVSMVMGAAPEAKVAPIRCIDRVVLGVSPTPVAKAILHAVQAKADVISMSLGGGLYSPAMARAMQHAVRHGLIIVAAGGNCVQPIVVFPANDRNAIALGGSNIDDAPWKGSSRGRRIDVCAPAENVRVARRNPGDPDETLVKPSQGTSFATALTAGVAALWIAHHGRDAVRAEARRRGTTVNELFRHALRSSARKPTPDWDERRFGAGIVDAAALLDLDLARIPARSDLEDAGPAADVPEEDLVAALEEALEGIETHAGDWPRLGAEGVFLLHDAWLRLNRPGAIPLESPAQPRASAGMRARMPAAVARGLAALRAEPEVLPPAGAAASTVSHVRMLAARGAQGPESSAALSPEAARERLRNGGKERLVQLADKALSAIGRRAADGGEERGLVMRAAPEVIDKAAAGELDSLDAAGRITLEALIRINDRPAYRVVDGSIDPEDPLYGEWGGFLALLVRLERWTAAVCRVNLDGRHVGSGFLCAPGRVMTNRHVLEACADEVALKGESRWFFTRGAVTVDFSDGADGSRGAEVTGVAQAGPLPIGGLERLDHLDMAVLEIDPAQAPEGATPLPFTRSLDADADLMVIGFPARPGTAAMVDPATGLVNREMADRLRTIFGTDYGRKYVSPGHMMAPTGTLAADRHGWVFTHDSTTLGGNSGSVVVQLGGTPAVAGLHFSGAPLTSNRAHALGAVDASFAGPIRGPGWI